MNPVNSPRYTSTPNEHRATPSPASSNGSISTIRSASAPSNEIGFTGENSPRNRSGCTIYRTWEHTNKGRNDQYFRRHISQVSIPFSADAEVTCSINDDQVHVKHAPVKAVIKEMGANNKKTPSPSSTSSRGSSLDNERSYFITKR